MVKFSIYLNRLVFVMILIHSLYNEIGWETLEKRRNNHKLILFYKIYNNLTPDYLSSLVPSSFNEVSRYNLRNANDVQTFNARTALYFNSYLPSVIREWNTVPAHYESTSIQIY